MAVWLTITIIELYLRTVHSYDCVLLLELTTKSFPFGTI